MIDQRLQEADATDLDELRVIMEAQENSDCLCPIEMRGITIAEGAVVQVIEAVQKLTDGNRILMVSDSTEIFDSQKRNVKKRVENLLREKFDVEWIVIEEPGSIVHCTPENAAKIQAKFPEMDCVVGVGSGTICDLCKYATYYAAPESPLPLIIVQTALSVNAFSDNSSVMLINGVKRTVHSCYPDILIIDIDIVSAAPAEMNVSGYGDLIATWTAPVDWYLANVLGMNSRFHTAPSDMIRTQCKRLLENSARLKQGDIKIISDLANVLTLSGLSMGLANESSPASGSEHVMSHLIDMAAPMRHTGICYHGTQVAVSGIISALLWDYLLHEFDPKTVDLDKCYPSDEEMRPRVIAAFSWLDNNHRAADECWSDYEKKLSKWRENRNRFEDFLKGFSTFCDHVSAWVQKPSYIVSCMHTAGAPCRYSTLNFPVDAKTARWAITNCHMMRNRFSIIDLLHFMGIWNEVFVEEIIRKADALDAGL